MLDSIYIAATGLHAEQAHIDSISNNLANLNTTAFKKNRVSFDDLMYRDVTEASSAIDRQDQVISQGMGSSISSTGKDFSVGDLKQTDNPMNVAIRGKGFLEVELENGEAAYTRTGTFRVDADGFLQTTSGYRLASHILIPPDASEMVIDKDGAVKVRLDNSAKMVEVGNLDVVNFLNPTGLEAGGDNLYMETEQSGRPIFSRPGESGTGTLAQGFLESSNVDLVEELLELVVAQRGYEVSSQVIRVSDEILRINNNLRS